MDLSSSSFIAAQCNEKKRERERERERERNKTKGKGEKKDAEKEKRKERRMQSSREAGQARGEPAATKENRDRLHLY